MQQDFEKLTNRRSTARDRIDLLMDQQSFVEIGAFVKPRQTDYNMTTIEAPADGVVTGYGTIEGRLTYVFSQDASVIGGALGEMHAKKIIALYDLAIKTGAPIIGLLDSAGMRLQEGTDALEGYGQIFVKQSMASGIIPQIMAVLGTCGGSGALIPSLADFTFMKKEGTSLYLNSANTLDHTKASNDTLSGSIFNATESGMVDLVLEDETQLLAGIRTLIELLPSNNKEEAPYGGIGDDLNRLIPSFNRDISKGLDGRAALFAIADVGTFMELKSEFGKDITLGLGKLGNMTVGLIANQATESDGRISLQGCEKIAEFVCKLDAFGIPLVTLVDVVGFTASLEETQAGQSKVVAKMMSNFIHATVPKISILTHRAIGSAYVALNSKHIGADFVFAWPEAQVSFMEAESAVRIMYAKEIETSTMASDVIKEKTKLYKEEQMSPYKAASRGYIDDIIEPAATRKRLIAALEMLYTKYMVSPERKHRSV
ncbi:MAG: carboxyl transferase [Firmicutes bacterium HGW-Firmicutes-2]|jgi:acetyl-CoA carboxylase carboxyltransferase component|nr:MAG: carboxyl transferase [Firmicutes bacterium HGW-Firmicutes-2]